MGKIGYGYGSEWHLLRYLGYHREYLNRLILEKTGGTSIQWLDFKFSNNNSPLLHDKELKGLEFILDKQVQEIWKSFWPQTGNPQNWDAVGKLNKNGREEWLLVEAKGHLEEINSDCGAKNSDSIQQITSALLETSAAFGNNEQPIENWLKNYYQYANRLAVLNFLTNKLSPLIPANLLFIYFVGDNQVNFKCPQNKEEWIPALDEMEAWLGIKKNAELNKRVYKLFLPVNPNM